MKYRIQFFDSIEHKHIATRTIVLKDDQKLGAMIDALIVLMRIQHDITQIHVDVEEVRRVEPYKYEK